MSEKVGKELIKREPGFLYFVVKDGSVEAAPMKNKPGKRHVVSKEKVTIDKKYMYFLGKSGYVERAPRKVKAKAEEPAKKPDAKKEPAKK